MGPRAIAEDSIKGNPQVLQALTRIISRKIAKPGDLSGHWYNHPSYTNLFRAVREDKFRREYNKQMANKYGKDAMTRARALNPRGMLNYLLIICYTILTFPRRSHWFDTIFSE